MRVILLSNGLNDPVVKALGDNDVVKAMLSKESPLRITYCEDGYAPRWRKGLQIDIRDGFHWWCQKLARKCGVDVQLRLFTFDNDETTNLQVLRSTDLFYFAGTGGGTNEYLLAALHNPTNSAVVKELMNLVCYNEMIYLGVCGSAKIAGFAYDGQHAGTLFGFFGQFRNIDYEDSLRSFDDKNSFHITAGTGIAVDLTGEQRPRSSAFVICQKSKDTTFEKIGEFRIDNLKCAI